jgi:hypothetical protein
LFYVLWKNTLKPNLVIMHQKVILIQFIQTTSNIENHFYINVSKHKSILLNSLLTKINSVKLNSIKINYICHQTKHILCWFPSFFWNKCSFPFSFSFLSSSYLVAKNSFFLMFIPFFSLEKQFILFYFIQSWF